MKEFLLFAGSDYYPYGGWEDFVDSFDTFEEALERAVKIKQDWYQIVNSSTSTMVSKGR